MNFHIHNLHKLSWQLKHNENNSDLKRKQRSSIVALRLLPTCADWGCSCYRVCSADLQPALDNHRVPHPRCCSLLLNKNITLFKNVEEKMSTNYFLSLLLEKMILKDDECFKYLSREISMYFSTKPE